MVARLRIMRLKADSERIGQKAYVRKRTENTEERGRHFGNQAVKREVTAS